MTSNTNLQPHESTPKAHLQPKFSTFKGKFEIFAPKNQPRFNLFNQSDKKIFSESQQLLTAVDSCLILA